MLDTHATSDRIGIEIGATKLQAVRGSAGGSVLREVRETAKFQGGAEAILAQVLQMVDQLLKDGPVESLGVGFGGPVDVATGTVLTSHQVSGWDNFPLAARLSSHFHVPCSLLNDSDAAALAEATCGAGRQRSCVFYTNIGSGIGAGLVREGQLYTGPGGALEFGHTWAYSRLENRVERLEELCSGWAIARRAANRDSAGRTHVITISSPVGGDARDVVRNWLQGEASAIELMEDVIDTFGRSLANIVALLNPDMIVIGGGLSLVGQPLMTALREAVQRYAFAPFAMNWTLVPAELGEQCVTIGALLGSAHSEF